MLMEYLVRGEYAWLVYIVLFIVIGVGIAVYVGNRQAYRMARMKLEFQQREANEERRMKQLVIEHEKPKESKNIAVIDQAPSTKGD